MANWSGELCVIVGAGPSAAKQPLDLLRDRARVIAVNESWRLVPWADILFATDGAWWRTNKGLPEFQGRRVTASPYAMKTYGIDLFASIGSTSGIRAIYLAEKMQADPILLVGFEHHVRNGVHWHDPHKERNPGKREMMVWRDEALRLAPKFAARGTRVINCTPDSDLKCFPYMPFLDALNGSHISR